VSARRSGSFGRVLIDASPVRTLVPGASDVIAVKNRRVVPEFKTSITSSGTTGRGTPLMVSKSPDSDTLTSAPMLLDADIVALTSAERSGYAISDLFDRAATAIARWL
jgi:hypothetical protein